MGENELKGVSEVFALAIKLISQNNNSVEMKQTLSAVLNLEQKTLSYLVEKVKEDEEKAEKKSKK